MRVSRAPGLFIPALLAIAIGSSSASALSPAEDWPQWRGPARDGKSRETGLLASWPEGGPELVWAAEGAGIGFSSVAVVGERLFTMGDRGDRQYVVAFSTVDGTELWHSELGAAWIDDMGGPRSTPTISGERLYALGSESDLVCLDVATGREIWRRNLQDDFGGRMHPHRGGGNWRFAESPLVDGPRVVVTPGAPDAMMVALDSNSGEEIWRTAIPELGELGSDGAGYSSAIWADAGGAVQYIQLVGRGVIGVDANTGEFLWGYNRIANDVANIPTPLSTGDHVLSATGYGAGAALLQIVPRPGGVEAEEVWFNPGNTMQNHHGGMVLHEGTVYLGHGHNRGFPMAVDLASGEAHWGPIRNDGLGSAAVSYADGHLYYRYQNGLMMLIEATPDEYREKGSFWIPDAEQPSWPHPVIAGGRLYLREQDRVLAYDISDPAATD